MESTRQQTFKLLSKSPSIPAVLIFILIVFTELLTKSCAEQTKNAIKYEGQEAIESSFEY